MKKTMILAALVVGSAFVVSSAKAGEFGYGGCRGGEYGGEWGYHVDSFCKEHGVKFSHGYFYPGLVQKHFTEKWFDEYHKTDMCFDPHSHMPYYFCAGHGVWYPISYIEMVGPGAKGPGPVLAGGPKGGAPGGPAVVAPVPGAVVPGAVVPGDGAVVPEGGAGATPVAPGAGGTPVAPGGAGGTVAPGGAGVVAPKGDAPAAPAPIKAASAPSSPEVAKTLTVAKKDAPAGTFDDAIPDDVK